MCTQCSYQEDRPLFEAVACAGCRQVWCAKCETIEGPCPHGHEHQLEGLTLTDDAYL